MKTNTFFLTTLFHLKRQPGHATPGLVAKQATVSTAALRPLIEDATGRIMKAAERGESRCAHPLYGYKGRCCDRMKEALWAELRRLGFAVKHHPDPDPGHPASAPYDEVSW